MCRLEKLPYTRHFNTSGLFYIMYDRHVSVGRLKVAGVSALSTENVLLVY